MAHGIGKALDRGFSGEGWYLGDYRGSDVLAEKTLGMMGGVKSDLGGTSSENINYLIEQYESGKGPLPEGRLGDIIKFSQDMKGSVKGEFDVKRTLAGYGVDEAKKQKELIEGKKGGLDNWLSGNLYNIERGKDVQDQKSNLLSGSTRGTAMQESMLRDESKQKFGEVDKQIDLANIGINKAKSAGDLLEYDESKAMINIEKDRFAQINQIKDLLYELETQSLQFG